MSIPLRSSIRLIALWALMSCSTLRADAVETVDVEAQPLAANITRLAESMEYLGSPLPAPLWAALAEAGRARDASKLQALLDPHVLLVVDINPEDRVRVHRGPAGATLQQGGYTPIVVKVINRSVARRPLRITSPQGGAVYAGTLEFSLNRQGQTELGDNPNTQNDPGRFLDIEMFDDPPMTRELSGLEAEYAIALIYSSESGKREATLGFDTGQGTQDLGFRGETAVLFDVRPAVSVRVAVADEGGQPTTAGLVIRDDRGRVYPPQPKRLAPDLFFQPQVYRADGETVLLPPGEFTVASGRGPEYLVHQQRLTVSENGPTTLKVELHRWVDPSRFGFFSGDHHIHAAGCAHYTIPTVGIHPRDVLRQIKGEGLHVGSVLNWAYGWEEQSNFFSPTAHPDSEPRALLKYDLEISGFASQALGHICLLNLQEHQYPGSVGTEQGWPTWTVPILRWAKSQGAVTGYPHSAGGMEVDPAGASALLMKELDKDGDGRLNRMESDAGLLPEQFAAIDFNADTLLSVEELERSHDRVVDQLPNLAIPGHSGSGPLEIYIAAAEGVCDFISSMDTARVPEWNTWYHLLNCGLPIKTAGETDYPCMSSRRVGQGRTYVQLGQPERIEYAQWIEGLRLGRSYVSDGFAHALRFTVNGQSPGYENVALDESATVTITATVSFAPEQPLDVPYGNVIPPVGVRKAGDTVVLYGPRGEQTVKGGERLVEVILNGAAVASIQVPANGQPHDLSFQVPVERSSWIALRQFPQLHTNPVNVLVRGQPIRASRESALWCAKGVDRVWAGSSRFIAEHERDEARLIYERAQKMYLEIADEAGRAP